ncbi:MAG: hypothetical protein D6693_00295 [Planctomycetota bacterium]|nr:MAG: hypothetical protein D6693_00295 [Planctomycetota bacterium]
MSRTDDAIRRALRAERDDLLADLDEPNMLSQALTTMRRGTRWINALVIVFTLVFFGLQIWTAVRFFGATEVKHMIAWAVGFSFCALAVAMLKLWFWMQMDKYVILREVKRLELQVARLSEKLAESL